MYTQIIENLEKQLSPHHMEQIKSKKIHLGIFCEPYLTYMSNGRKTIDSRFSKNKIAPYNKITKADIVIVKKSGGDVLGFFTIRDVLFFNLNTVSIDTIKSKYNRFICADDAFWISKQQSNYATLIAIDKFYKLKPFHINKKGMQSWIVF